MKAASSLLIVMTSLNLELQESANTGKFLFWSMTLLKTFLVVCPLVYRLLRMISKELGMYLDIYDTFMKSSLSTTFEEVNCDLKLQSKNNLCTAMCLEVLRRCCDKNTGQLKNVCNVLCSCCQRFEPGWISRRLELIYR